MFLGKQKQIQWTGLAVIAIAALILVSSPVPVAASQIHFDIDTPTMGIISWAGGANPLIGTDIEVDQVIGLGTPSNDGVTGALIGGSFDFITGACVDSSVNASVYTWTFAGGGSLNLTGAIDFPDVASDIATTTLISGEFLFGGLTHLDYFSATEKWFVTYAAFVDEKNEDLLEYYGMPTDVPYNGKFNISFEVINPAVLMGFESSTLLSGDISNYPPPVVPIPASALLLGSGMVGLIGFGKRMRRKLF